MLEPVRTEELDHGVTIEWYEDDIVAFTNFEKQSRQAMDVWAQKVIDETVRTNGKVRHLFDFTYTQAVITPYFRKKSKEINTANRNVKGYLAVVFKENLLSQAIRLFINREINKEQPGIKSHIFFNKEDALTWLREQKFV